MGNNLKLVQPNIIIIECKCFADVIESSIKVINPMNAHKILSSIPSKRNQGI